MFDTIGTLIGVSTKAGMLDEEGHLPNIKGALMADAVATTVGAVLGTTTTTTFVESASGVSEGGRTGLTSATTAILFGLSLFLSPIFLAIPSFATAPALIVVGFYMLTNVTHIELMIFRSTAMLHLYPGYAIFLQHLRRYLYGSDFLRDPESDDWKGKRKEDQRINVCTCGIIHIEIYLSVKYNRKWRTKRDRCFRSLL